MRKEETATTRNRRQHPTETITFLVSSRNTIQTREGTVIKNVKEETTSTTTSTTTTTVVVVAAHKIPSLLVRADLQQ